MEKVKETQDTSNYQMKALHQRKCPAPGEVEHADSLERAHLGRKRTREAVVGQAHLLKRRPKHAKLRRHAAHCKVEQTHTHTQTDTQGGKGRGERGEGVRCVAHTTNHRSLRIQQSQNREKVKGRKKCHRKLFITEKVPGKVQASEMVQAPQMMSWNRTLCISSKTRVG
jgi:hypothetical protein